MGNWQTRFLLAKMRGKRIVGIIAKTNNDD